MSKRKCPQCGKQVDGRSGKLFCDVLCKNRFHEEKTTTATPGLAVVSGGDFMARNQRKLTNPQVRALDKLNSTFKTCSELEELPSTLRVLVSRGKATCQMLSDNADNFDVMHDLGFSLAKETE